MIASPACKILPSHARTHTRTRVTLRRLGVVCKRYAIATYRIVSYPGIVCLLRAPGTKRGQRPVMNAWNLSMDGAPMINRTCSAYPRWSAPVALYSRERDADERGEGRTRTHGRPKLEGNVFLRRVPTVCIATPRADKSLSRFYAHPYVEARSRRRTWDRVSPDRVYAVTRTEKIIRGWTAGGKRVLILHMNKAFYLIFFLSMTFSILGDLVKSEYSLDTREKSVRIRLAHSNRVVPPARSR